MDCTEEIYGNVSDGCLRHAAFLYYADKLTQEGGIWLDKELRIQFNDNAKFYMVGIKKAGMAACGDGLLSCFACQFCNNESLADVWEAAEQKLGLFKGRYAVTEVGEITAGTYAEVYDVDIASAVSALHGCNAHSDSMIGRILNKIKGVFR